MKCLSFLVIFILYSICSAEFTAEDEILAKCKYIQCKNVTDLQKEDEIRQCVTTTCRYRVIIRAGLVDACKSHCIEVVETRPTVVSDESLTILDFSWLD